MEDIAGSGIEVWGFKLGLSITEISSASGVLHPYILIIMCYRRTLFADDCDPGVAASAFLRRPTPRNTVIILYI